jgi:uncharacterized repeat protein (TIGR03803 family)
MIGAAVAPAQADSLKALHRFADTGNSTQSHYALGASPYGELLQASDGNFYGTTINGGSGSCPNFETGHIVGCGTIFRMTPQGTVTVLYAFPYDASSSTAPDGAYPTAGLIQGSDGYLYGVAQDGGAPIYGCGALGCGTLFRISTAGAFTLLHQFCHGDGCPTSSEGAAPMAHLIQLPNKSLCGTTAQGGIAGRGTLFCASTAGSVNTLYGFQPANGTDGYDPVAALVVGPDGQTLYGTTTFGGANGQGTVFAFLSGTPTTLHAFGFNADDMSGNPESALIFGADGKLYGTTYNGNPAGGIFALNTDGTGFSSQNVFDPDIAGRGFEATSGLLLASNGLMYGATYAGGTGGDNGSIYSYNPVKKTYKTLASFVGNTGAAPRAALMEAKDGHLYGTTTLYGGSNARGGDVGTIVRLSPALKQ